MSDGLELVVLENTDEAMRAHPESKCAGEICCIHNRTDHCMRSFPQHWRYDRGIMERICRHGVGHPDPDDWMNTDTVHGCCSPPCCGVIGEEDASLEWKIKYVKAPADPTAEWADTIDPYAEIENLRNALTLALERETAKKVKIRELERELEQLKDGALRRIRELNLLHDLLELYNEALGKDDSSIRCPRCTGATTLYGGRALVCFECIREEEFEA